VNQSVIRIIESQSFLQREWTRLECNFLPLVKMLHVDHTSDQLITGQVV